MKSLRISLLSLIKLLLLVAQGLLFTFPARADVTNCVPPFSGLISWWRGDGLSTDVVGGNNGVPVGNVSFGPGKVGQAFELDGDQDGVMVGTAANLQLQDFSIEGWIKRVSATSVSLNGNGGGMIFSLGAAGGGFGFYIQQSENRLALGKL